MPRHRWYRFPRHFINSLERQYYLELLQVEREYDAVSTNRTPFTILAIKPSLTSRIREPRPLVRWVRSGTVAKVDSIGLVGRRVRQHTLSRRYLKALIEQKI